MSKLAVFVEGQTEQLFVQRLVEEVAGRHNVAIEMRKASFGGRSGLTRSFVRRESSDARNKQFFVLIVDCGTDNRVASDIRDEYASLVNAGYSRVLGLRDVYPQPRSKIPAMRSAIKPFLPKGSIPVDIVLAIMEIEAWFLAECTHFERLYAGITLANVNNAIGSDALTLDVESIAHPSETLNTIYQLVGRAYRKNKDQVSDIVDELDYARLYLELTERVSALKCFCDHLDSFLSLEMTPEPPT